MYGLYNKNSRLNLFGYSLALNIFPLVAIPALAMGDARVAGVPIAYIPMIASGLVLFISYGIRINYNNKTLYYLMLVFFLYTLIIALFKGVSITTFIYWLMWVFNFSLFIVTVNIFSKADKEISTNIIKKIMIILVLGSLIGIFRFIVGISSDSNFMPMFNRNGTIVMVVMLAPLMFYLFDNKKINHLFFWFSYITIFICLLFLGSRSGFLGFLLTSFLYLLLHSKVNFVRIITIVIVVFSFLLSPLGGTMKNKLSAALISVSTVLSGETIEAGKADYKRNILILSAIEIIKNDFWFGAGVGVENYQKGFHKYVDFSDHDSLAHNFYLSYFSQLGLFGFLLLMLILFLIYKKLSKNKDMAAFRISFFGMAVMMTMNEYIGLPEIWFFYGILVGISINESAILERKSV